MLVRRMFVLVALVSLPMVSDSALGAGIFCTETLAGGCRWDAAPRTFGGLERSLQGGLRYSLQGGSFEAYRDLFNWGLDPPPSTDAFRNAVEAAFNDWTSVDAISGLGTSLLFTPDLTTPVSAGFTGAEIDLLAADLGPLSRSGTTTITFSEPTTVTLTSGTQNYPGNAIVGANISLNSNHDPRVRWTLFSFRLFLAHEIGHAIGLSDVDLRAGPAGKFIDDNYDPSSSETTVATLTNSWARLVNANNPAASPLQLYFVANGDPGFDTDGVDILMESMIPGATNESRILFNDDFGGRQFLYPVNNIPEPATLALFSAVLVTLAAFRKRIRHRRSARLESAMQRRQ